MAKRDFQLAADDYEKVLRLQTPVFSKLPVHWRGELLGGLAEAWNDLGDTKKSRGYLQRMMEEFSRYFLFAASKGILVSGTKTRGAGNDLPRLPGRRGHLIVEQNYPLEISSSAESAPNAALQR
jgi:hypothetical protein